VPLHYLSSAISKKVSVIKFLPFDLLEIYLLMTDILVPNFPTIPYIIYGKPKGIQLHISSPWPDIYYEKDRPWFIETIKHM